MKNVFIIGSKGIPANYGGFETFVEYLTKNKVTESMNPWKCFRTTPVTVF